MFVSKQLFCQQATFLEIVVMSMLISIPAMQQNSNIVWEVFQDNCHFCHDPLGSFVQPRADLSDEDASKLGMKNEDDEVEKFVMANTQELGK